jgi:hypothetical protein
MEAQVEDVSMDSVPDAANATGSENSSEDYNENVDYAVRMRECFDPKCNGVLKFLEGVIQVKCDSCSATCCFLCKVRVFL